MVSKTDKLSYGIMIFGHKKAWRMSRLEWGGVGVGY
jgi:hypothetical protein